LSHNPIYDRLVGTDENNIAKLVAYAIYKRHKRAWLRQRAENGPVATTAEVEIFVSGCEADLQSYINRAELALNEYGEQIVDAVRSDLHEEAITEEIASGLKRMESGGTLFRQIGTGVLAWVVSLIILLLAAWAAKTLGVDLLSVLKSEPVASTQAIAPPTATAAP